MRLLRVCVLGKVDEARQFSDKAIEIGGKQVKLRALEDADLERLGAGLTFLLPVIAGSLPGINFFRATGAIAMIITISSWSRPGLSVHRA